jgi:glycosyltransferase involved in cell wall biosynthesis
VPKYDTTVPKSALPVRVALLSNILPNYRVALLEQLQSMVTDLRIFISARTESNRGNPASWGSLDVCVQRSISWSRRFINVHGFEDITHTHVPVDTYLQLSRFHPDVIITGEFGARTIFVVLYGILHRRTKIILWATLSQRTENTRGSLRNSLRRWLLGHVHRVFVNGADGGQYIRKMGFTGPIVEVPYVVDNLAFGSGTREVSTDGSISLFYAGQLIERKGLMAFLQALGTWSHAHPEVHLQLRVAGTGPQLQQLQGLAKALGVPTKFIGHLEVDALAREYDRASIYVFPTYADEWGVVVNEALSAGLPVLGSCHSQAVEELIRDGENGWIFDPMEEESLLSALNRSLTTSVAQRVKMSDTCRRSMENYTLEKIARRICDSIAAVYQS